MFSAIREYFARPDDPPLRRGRGRRLAALFVFEFVVVLFGVLAAQLLQDWFSARGDVRRAREAVAALDEETKRFATVAEYRLRAHKCETDRLERLTAVIRSGEAASEAERATPIMPMPIVTEWSDSTRALVARHGSSRTLNRYDALRLLAHMISERQRQLENQWADFRLLAPEVRSTQDRGVLALAAARSQGLLTMIDSNAGHVRKYYTADVRLDEKSMAAVARMDHPCAAAALVPLPRAEARPAGG